MKHRRLICVGPLDRLVYRADGRLLIPRLMDGMLLLEHNPHGL
jgi:hypothetical protein